MRIYKVWKVIKKKLGVIKAKKFSMRVLKSGGHWVPPPAINRVNGAQYAEKDKALDLTFTSYAISGLKKS